ncbi:MAG: cadherin repeat domain-containing protein, partial [Roseibium sp.]
MAKDTDIRETDVQKTTSAEGDESRTTLSSDDYLHSGLLDSRDPHLDKVHDYHLDQDMGESMEQVNSNLHLGSNEDEENNLLAGQDSASASPFESDGIQPLGERSQAPFSGLQHSSDGSVSSNGSLGQSTEDSALGALSGANVADPQSDFTSNSSRSLNGNNGADADYTLAGSNGFDDQSSSPVAESGANTDRSNDGNQAPTADALQPEETASNLSNLSDFDLADNAVSEAGGIGTSTGIQATAEVADGASVTYSLTDNAGGLFSIDPVTGVVSVAGELDAETAGSHTIEVLATASDGATETELFTITVQDDNEFDVSQVADTDATANDLSEDATSGTYTGITVSADDQDVSDTITYSVNDNRFVIDEDGIVTVADGAVFDTETEPMVSIIVTATSSDGSSTSDTYNLTITDVNESAVSAVTDTDGSANTIAENAGDGASTGIQVSATDADASDSVT